MLNEVKDQRRGVGVGVEGGGYFFFLPGRLYLRGPQIEKKS